MRASLQRLAAGAGQGRGQAGSIAAARPRQHRPPRPPARTGTTAAAAAAAGPAAASAASAAGPAPQRLEGAPLEARLDGLQLLQQEFLVAGAPLRLVCPRDPDEVLDRYIASGADGDPYWTRAWPSAIALAGELLRRPQLVAGLRVADLGAGLGVAGIAAALAGAREVVLLDREPLALRCALMSARATGLGNVDDAPMDGAATAAAAAAAAAGRRGSGAAAGPSGRPGGCAVSAAVFDWTQPPALPRFDVVLACDVLYEPDAVEPIAAAVPRLLKASSGLLLLSDPPNRTARNRERFLQLLQHGDAPFALDECYEQSCSVNQIDPEMKGGVRGETVPVQFHALRRVLGGDTVGLK